ncbi:MAG: hypothetical protein ACXWT1_20040 [Methylobacter sp.]
MGQWLLLEADREVTEFCERPCRLHPKVSKRLVDFWVKTRTEEYGLLIQTAQETHPDAEMTKDAPIKEIRSVSLKDLKAWEQRIQNWRLILPYLIANRTLITQDLTDSVMDLMHKPQSLGSVEHYFRGRDSVLIRAALFKLLHQGHIVSEDLDKRPLDTLTQFFRCQP